MGYNGKAPEIHYETPQVIRGGTVVSEPPAVPNEHSTTPSEMIAERQLSGIEVTQASALRLATGADEQAINFAQNLGANEAEIARLNNALNLTVITAGNDPKLVQTVLADIVSKKTPDQLLTAFEKEQPSAKPFLDIIRGDDELKGALHNAVSKDITVLGGLEDLTGEHSSIGQDRMVSALQDPKNRHVVAQLLNVTAENPDLQFSDFTQALDAGVALSGDQMNSAKQQKWKEALNRFKVTDSRLEFADQLGSPLEMLGQMWADPRGFFDKMATLIGGGPAQIAALKGIGGFMANIIGMYSEDPNLNEFAQTYGGQASQFVSDITGQSDKKNPIGASGLTGDNTNPDAGSVSAKRDFQAAGTGAPATPEATPKITPASTPVVPQYIQAHM